MQVLQITLKELIPDFCMSQNETLEFVNGAHRRKDSNRSFYPNFGPYIQLNEIAELMISGKGNSEMHRLFRTETKSL